MNSGEFKKLLVDAGVLVKDTTRPGKYALVIAPSTTVNAGDATITDPLNSAISQDTISGATIAALSANFQTWKNNNATKSITSIVQIAGLDGEVGVLIEHTNNGAFPLASVVGHETFTGANIAAVASAYQTWKTDNPAKKALSRTYITSLEGEIALLVTHTNYGSLPINSAISQTTVTGVDIAAVATNFQNWKTANPTKQTIARTYITGSDGEVGLLIEYIT